MAASYQRGHFQMHFPLSKFLHLYQHFTNTNCIPIGPMCQKTEIVKRYVVNR